MSLSSVRGHGVTISDKKLGIGERLTFRKMFGEYALYVDDKVVETAALMAPPKPKKKAGTNKKVG